MPKKAKFSKKIFFRVDASEEIGSGHVMRCLTLADKLNSHGADILFICKSLAGDMNSYIRERGYYVIEIPEGPLEFEQKVKSDIADFDLKKTLLSIGELRADWLVVDNYRLDAAWERGMRSVSSCVMVIDDLADRNHDCEILLDQNLRKNALQRYRLLVPEACSILTGPSHVLLNPKFTETPQRERDGSVRNVLIYFGGNDVTNQAGKAIEALRQIPELTVTVILGFSHPHRKSIFASTERDTRFYVMDTCQDMAGQMAKADLALGTCGISAWERCALGLPTLVTVSAENQREDAETLHELGAVEYLADAEALEAQDWLDAVNRCRLSPAKVRQMGQAAKKIVAGHTENMQKLVNQLLDDHVY
jgi:UDP-2,4-diacetamido-2,4,6-trideoxy-beta-L-altropyranose hydrolase